MQRGARLQAQHYRELAERFRLLAETEPLASLHRHLRRLSEQHDELAARIEPPDPTNSAD